MAPSIYHERQIRELCALHCLNNLFQEKGTFSKSQFDEICKNLSPGEWINPHRSVLGLGNYDINCIMAALQLKNFSAIWFDKRKDPEILIPSKIFGFILNVPSDYKIGFMTLPFNRRHWICIRKMNDSFYNLDSKLDSPLNLGNEKDLINYLRTQLQSNDKELFIVTQKQIEQDESWFIIQPN